MSSVKTAISLEQGLLKRISDLAKEMNVSRSRLFVLAVEDFLHKNENQRLLRQINEAYSDSPTEEELRVQQMMERQQFQIAREEKW